MSKHEQYPERDALRSSPTGRVPQWVMDEALGRTVEPVPFRGPVSTPRPRRGRLRRPLALATVTLACAGLYFYVVPSTPGRSTSLTAVATTNDHAPPPDHEESKHPLTTAPRESGLAEGPTFRFLSHQPHGKKPVTWSPCRPVHYVVRPDNAPPGGAELVHQAVLALSAATGLQLVDDGATSEGPSEDRQPFQPQRYGKRWAPVLIAWATTDEVPDFGVDIAGEAGPVTVRTPSGDETYVSGTVYLDAAKLGASISRGEQPGALAVVLHELGHLAGLAHVPDARQVMFPRAQRDVSAYSSGDLAGLAALGHGACQPDV